MRFTAHVGKERLVRWLELGLQRMLLKHVVLHQRWERQ